MNIHAEIDDSLVKEAQKLTQQPLQELIEGALRELIRQRKCRRMAEPALNPVRAPAARMYELDATLVTEAIEASGLQDARAAIERAIREYVRLEAQEALANLFGKVPLQDVTEGED